MTGGSLPWDRPIRSTSCRPHRLSRLASPVRTYAQTTPLIILSHRGRARLLPGAHPSEQSKTKRMASMERALPGDRLAVGVTHSEGTRTVRIVFHQK
jgi:hypothetical protein